MLHSLLGECFLFIRYTTHTFSSLPLTFLFSLCLFSLTPCRGNSRSLPFLKVPYYLEHPEIVLSWVGYHSAKHIIYDIFCIFVISLCQCLRLYIELLFQRESKNPKGLMGHNLDAFILPHLQDGLTPNTKKTGPAGWV